MLYLNAAIVSKDIYNMGCLKKDLVIKAKMQKLQNFLHRATHLPVLCVCVYSSIACKNNYKELKLADTLSLLLLCSYHTKFPIILFLFTAITQNVLHAAMNVYSCRK